MARREQFLSRLGFVAAAIGMAVGTGNIWRFPRMAAQYGGGVFVLVYILALFLWSAPLLMVEMAIGRKTRMGPIGGFRDFLREKYTWMGGWMVAVCLLITFYYAVITGWCAKYFVLALQGAFRPGVDTASLWNNFLHNPWQNVFYQALAIGACGLIIYKGVQKGIEKINKIMVPALFFFLIVAAVRAVTLPGASLGLRYLFVPDWSKLADPATWLQAFTQSAWSTGAGWGLLLTYAVYTRKGDDIPQNCLIVGFGDNSAALLAGMAVIPTIFALSPNLDVAKASLQDNMGLTFISLAGLFPRMKGGMIIAPLFFLAMLFAALSSLIAEVELGVRALMDFGWTRKKSTSAVILICFVLGLPSAAFPSFLLNQDWVWGMALLVSGFWVILAARKYGVEKIRRELINPGADIKMGGWWTFILKYVSPFIFLVVTGWWFYQAIGWDKKTWWHPFKVNSVGTILFQWLLLLVVLILLNKFLVRWTKKTLLEDED
ncbi:MAG: sodium-dependent transporter [Candidatus Aminicenantes bacterium]|nr:sodium-dependent transporter [Candidatus Aminicenantes bacterium]